MYRIVTLVVLCAILDAVVQSRGADKPVQAAKTTARGLLVDKQQVFVNVRMIEVSRTWMHDRGYKFPEPLESPPRKDNEKPSAGDQSHAPGLLGVVKPDDPFHTLLDELTQKGLAKTIAGPALITISGRPAYFASGGQVPILYQRVNGNSSIQYARFGSEVNLVPKVLRDGKIRLTVKPRFAELDKSLDITVGGRNVPGLQLCECEASADISSGDTMVLGGMTKTMLTEQRTDDGNGHQRTVEKELLVLVTPRLIDAPPTEEAKSVANGEAGFYGPADPETTK